MPAVPRLLIQNVTAQNIWLSVQWFQRFHCGLDLSELATVLHRKTFLVFQKVSSVCFEFKQKCGSFTLREGKLEGTSAIYTLVELRSVELPPSLQDMAVISWAHSSWSLCFTKAQGSTVEVVSVKLPRNGSMEVSYIQCYSATVYI